MSGRRRKILFLCTGNSCRSQMAEAFARHLHGDRLEPYSAGIAPSRLDPRATAVMREVGVDLAGQRSKSIDDLQGTEFDWVITVCDHANETCPVLPGSTRRLHAAFEDPPRLAAAATSELQALACYRRVRDQIREFVESLPRRLRAPAAGTTGKTVEDL